MKPKAQVLPIPSSLWGSGVVAVLFLSGLSTAGRHPAPPTALPKTLPGETSSTGT